jgi:flagellar biosynthetic protein FliR
VGALLFARLGAVLMLAPGWGEQMVPAQMRLAAAVLVTACLAPALIGHVPPAPAQIASAIPLVIGEILTGLILGGGARLLMSAVQVAGATVGIASGLGFAQQIDPVASQQAAIFSGFFSLMGVVLIMAAGLHRMMIQAVADSYTVFPPGAMPPVGPASEYIIGSVSAAFRLGIQIAAPVLIFSLLFNASLAVVARLMPQLQIFMIAMPLSVLLGLAITAIGLGGGMLAWLSEMELESRFLSAR